MSQTDLFLLYFYSDGCNTAASSCSHPPVLSRGACSTWTAQPKVQSRPQTRELLHAAPAKVCLNSHPYTIRHSWFAGQSKALHCIGPGHPTPKYDQQTSSLSLKFLLFSPLFTLEQLISQSKISHGLRALKLRDLGTPCVTA